jgi:hypothetical protein
MILVAKNRCTDKAMCAVDQPRVRVFRMLWHVPYERPNLPTISVTVFRRSSLKILRTFSTFFSVRPVEGRPELSASSTEVSPRLNRTTQNLCSPHGIVTET